MVLAAVTAAAACEAPPVPAPGGGHSLVVRSPVAGTVTVEGFSAAVTAREGVELTGLGAPPYTVTLEMADERVTLVDVPGPVVDFAAMVDRAPPVRGETVTVRLRLGASGAVEARALSRQQVLAARTLADGALALDLPADDGPVEVVALWSQDGRARRMARVRLSDVRRQAPEELHLEPDIVLDRHVAVSFAGEPAGHVRGELTYAGQPTGLILGGGFAEPGVAAAIPLPPPRRELRAFGVWISGTARRVGAATPVAAVADHVALSARAHTLRWAPPIDVAPAPVGDPTRAAPLVRSGLTLRWTAEATSATYVEVELDGRSGCERVRWRVIAPAAPGGLVLPPVAGPDPLAMPLIVGRFEAVTVADRTYADLFGAEAVVPSRLPTVTARVVRRAVAGLWRGGADDCRGAELTGRYAVVAAGDAGACRPGAAVAEGLIDRCGRWVPLAEGDGAGAALTCGRADGRRFVFQSGAAQAVQPVTWGDTTALALDHPDAPLVLVPWRRPDDVREPPPELRGAWHRVEVHVRDHAVEPDGAPGRALDAPALLFSGDGAGGPWLEVDDTGDLHVETPRVALRGALTAFDGRDGAVTLTPAVCPDGPLQADLRLDGNRLVLEMRERARREDRPVIRFTTLTFRR